MACCPDCKTRIAPWRTLIPETEANPLVCRACGARLRMTPGWLVKLGLWANTVTLGSTLFVPVVAHSRHVRVALVLSGVVAAIVVYAVFAPAEKA